MLYRLTHPLLKRLPAETAHAVTLWGLHLTYGGGQVVLPSLSSLPRLTQNILGMPFAHPLGLAAGADKNATAIAGMFGLGFAFAEFGTITPYPQSGNPKPRLFRLPQDEAVINRLGFNNQGAAIAKTRLATHHAKNKNKTGIIGINIGAHAYHTNETRIADYAEVAYALAEYADYITINLSSPNTPQLRALQKPATIGKVIQAVRVACTKGKTSPPIFVKLAPDFADKDFKATLDSLGACEVDGIILTNTTTARPPDLHARLRNEQGGLSGKPLMRMSTKRLAEAHQHFASSPTKTRPILIGVGGVDSMANAYAKLLAGASLVQLYTALIFKGPALIPKIVTGLNARLEADGVNHISEVVGQAKTAQEALAIAETKPTTAHLSSS